MCLRWLLKIIASCGNKPQSKNLFDINLLKGNPGITVDGNTFSGTAENLYSVINLIEKIPDGTRFKISCNAYTDQNEGSDTGTGVKISYRYENSSSGIVAIKLTNDLGTNTNKEYKGVASGRSVDRIALTEGATCNGNIWHISDLVVEIIQASVAITYMNGDVVYATETLEKGTNGSGPSSNPTKQSTAQYTYTFAGWSTDSSATTVDPDALKNVTSDRTVYAVYTETVRTYTITFVRAAEDGGGTLQTLNNVAYGTIPVYTGETPTTTKTGEWRFNGWSPAISAVTGDQTYTAVFADASSQTRKMINRTITSVADETLSVVGDYAFYSCTTVKTVSFPTATTIGEAAFRICGLLSASFPNVTNIGSYAFAECFHLTDISLPAVTSISPYAFYLCSSLATISMESATTIGSNAFNGCKSLISASFPHATEIGNSAFRQCSLLITTYFPVATVIGQSAFNSCTSLTAISFPLVTNIGSSAFTSCTHMSAFILGYESSVATLASSNVFMNNPTLIYVPNNLVDDYKAANNWSYYASRIKGMSEL